MRVSELELYISCRVINKAGKNDASATAYLHFALPHIARELFMESTALKVFRKFFKASLDIGTNAGFDVVELLG